MGAAWVLAGETGAGVGRPASGSKGGVLVSTASAGGAGTETGEAGPVTELRVRERECRIGEWAAPCAAGFGGMVGTWAAVGVATSERHTWRKKIKGLIRKCFLFACFYLFSVSWFFV